MIVHASCRHKHYRMTCEQFDELFAEAGGCCQVCRLPSIENSMNMLFIDHDASRGDWAVRGLLCNSCNTVLGKDREEPRDAAFAAYLANAWYIRMLAALGHAPGLPEEPPIGSVIHMGDRRPRMWRSPSGWVRAARPWPSPVTWWSLYRSAGPHNLRVVAFHKPRQGGRW